MKIIRNRFIPFKGFSAINLFGVLFCRYDSIITDTTINHEMIHTAQMKEVWYIPFYILYLIEYVKNLFKYKSRKVAYRKNCFEREAYAHDRDFAYLSNRKKFAWIHYR